MNPGQLTPLSFSQYPPQGRAQAIAHIDVLRRVPLALLPVLLMQFQRYDL